MYLIVFLFFLSLCIGFRGHPEIKVSLVPETVFNVKAQNRSKEFQRFNFFGSPNFLLLKLKTTDFRKDDCIGESTKRKWSSGLFWLDGAALYATCSPHVLQKSELLTKFYLYIIPWQFGSEWHFSLPFNTQSVFDPSQMLSYFPLSSWSLHILPDCGVISSL